MNESAGWEKDFLLYSNFEGLRADYQMVYKRNVLQSEFFSSHAVRRVRKA